MQIAEVSIEPKTAKTKKYSAKTKKAAEEFLSEMDLRIEQFDDDQKVHIFDHVKMKRMIRWSVPIMIIAFIINIATIFGYKHIFNLMADIFFQPEIKVEVIEDDGSTSYKKATERQLEMHRNYGLICAMISSSLTVALFSAITCLTGCIAWFFRARKKEKLFKAFLPALKIASPAMNPKFATLNS